MNSRGPSAIFHDRLDVRGPFASDFETSTTARRDIFYVGIGNNITRALEPYLANEMSNKPTVTLKMFATVLRPYPANTIGRKYAGIIDHKAHSAISVTDSGEGHE